MNWKHIWGLIRRNLYIWLRDLDRIFDAFWWGFFDVVIWGFMSTYFAAGLSEQFVGQLLAGLIFWAVLARSQWEVSASMLIESWEKNLINLFTSPLTVTEYITSTVILGLGKLVMVFLFMSVVALFFYRFNIFTMSWWIIPLLASLFLTSVWLALVINAMILRWGKNVMSFAWTLVLLINPVSGVVYPLSALPAWLRNVSLLVPSSYVFEGMRSILLTGSMDSTLLVTSFMLNGIYLVVSFIFFFYTFQKAREHGWLIKLV